MTDDQAPDEDSFSEDKPDVLVAQFHTGPHRFKTIREIRHYMQRERTYWEWLNGVGRRHPDLKELCDHVTSVFNLCIELIDKALTLEEDSPGDLPDALEEIEAELRWFYDGKYFLSHSAEARFIQRIRDMYTDSAAVSAYAVMVKNEWAKSNLSTGVACGVFSDLLDADSKIESMSEQLNAIGEGHREEIARLQEKLSEIETKEEERLAMYESRVSEFVSSEKEELEELRRKYKEVQEFREPINYWKEKAAEHKKNYWHYLWWFLWVGGIGVLILVGYSIGLMLFVVNPTYWTYAPKLAPMVLVAAVLFWVLRVLMRLSLSNFHLATDADERVVMAQVYLAMQDSGAKLEEAAKLVVLNQLFRHAATGVVKDDAAPPLPMKFITEEKVGGS